MSRARLFLILFLACLLLAACSRVQFAYDQADWLGARWVANYLDLDREQRRWVRSEIGTYRDFHRRQRLPEIDAFLQAVIEDIEGQHFQRDNIVSHLGEAEAILQRTTRDVLPTTAEVLADLDAEQRESLAEQFRDRREEQRERHREQAERSPEETKEALRSGVESWLGELSEEQMDMLMGCRDRLPDVGLLQHAWEVERQAELLERMAGNDSAESLAEYLQDWWLAHRGQAPELAAARALRREVTVDCLVSFLPTLSEDQRERVLDRLNGYQRDITGLLES